VAKNHPLQTVGTWVEKKGRKGGDSSAGGFQSGNLRQMPEGREIDVRKGKERGAEKDAFALLE